MRFVLHRRCRSADPDAAGAGPAALDADALARLRELDPDDSRGFVMQVLRTYEASVERHLARLATADGEALDAKIAGDVAHTLKSSSASVGALAFSASCARLERAVKTDDKGDIVPALAAMCAEGRRALAAVRAMLRN
jgi:HPt (histidine-containing phosphotransfer) domain-containing protein